MSILHRILVVLGCLLPLSCSVQESKPAELKPQVEFVDLAGLEAAIAKQRGHGFLLNFWALWCPPCVAELPELMEVAHEFREQGGRVVLVSFDMMVARAKTDTVRESVSAFAKQRGIDVPILVYEAADYDAINQRFDLPGGIPVTLAIDAEGRIVEAVEEQVDKARFQELMRRAIAGK